MVEELEAKSIQEARSILAHPFFPPELRTNESMKCEFILYFCI